MLYINKTIVLLNRLNMALLKYISYC